MLLQNLAVLRLPILHRIKSTYINKRLCYQLKIYQKNRALQSTS